MVFEKRWEYPIVLLKGAGQLAGQFRTLQAPQLRTQIALTQTTLEGAGLRAGQYVRQYLVDEDATANTPIALS
jgi:hypothetical protein